MRLSDYTEKQIAEFCVEAYLQNVEIEQAGERLVESITGAVQALASLDPLATVEIIKQLQDFIPELEKLAENRNTSKAKLEEKFLKSGRE